MVNVCEILGTKYPIIQGAMARIAEYNLASAVSNGGGLGIIAAGGQGADWLRDQIRKTAIAENRTDIISPVTSSFEKSF